MNRNVGPLVALVLLFGVSARLPAQGLHHGSVGRDQRVGALAAIVLLLGISARISGAGSERCGEDADCGIRWASSLEDAMTRGRAEQKPVLVIVSVRELGDPRAADY